MDVRIAHGDIARVASGSYEYITGIEEAVQRVRISALTQKGDFVYDRELGTDYTGLSADDELLKEKLDLRVKESCADIFDTVVEVLLWSQRRKTMLIKVTYQNMIQMTEVDLSGIIQ